MESPGKKHLPQFIVIGAMKSGTTSLQQYLALHPGIAMAPKELNYFSEGLEQGRGIDWYQQHFTRLDKVQGEISPSYSKCHLYPEIPQKIHEVNPTAKLIYVVREPISRIESHLSHSIGSDAKGLSAEEILADSYDNFVNTSRYLSQIERYLEFFELSQILVISAERLRKDRLKTLGDIFRFLGVDDQFRSENFDDIRHDSSVKVKRNMLGRIFAQYPVLRQLESGIKNVVPRSLYPLAGRLVGSRFEKPALPPDVRKKLVATLHHEVIGLRALTGNEFDEWNWN